jgi:hypothetical protein
MSRFSTAARWALAILAAVLAFAIVVTAKGFLYKGSEPSELPIWALATVAGCLVGTSVTPPGHGKAARNLFIAMAVVTSAIRVLQSLGEPTFIAADVYPVVGSVIGGVMAWALINPP